MKIERVVKTITLGTTVIVDDLEQSEVSVTPGEYKVYKVRGGRWDNYAFLFAHESVTNLDEQIARLDLDGTYSVEGGTYGLVTKPSGDADELWEKTLYDGDDFGYVAYTNEGDGSYTMYTNPERTLFLLDDEDIYMDERINERYSDYSVDAHDDVDGFHLEGDELVVYFMQSVPGARGHWTEAHYPVNPEKRTIDSIADALAATLEHIMDGYDACQKAWEERKKGN